MSLKKNNNKKSTIITPDCDSQNNKKTFLSVESINNNNLLDTQLKNNIVVQNKLFEINNSNDDIIQLDQQNSNLISTEIQNINQSIENIKSNKPIETNQSIESIKSNINNVDILTENEQLNKPFYNDEKNDEKNNEKNDEKNDEKNVLVDNLKKIIDDRDNIIKDLITQINILSTKTVELQQTKKTLDDSHSQLIEYILTKKNEIKNDSDIVSLMSQNNIQSVLPIQQASYLQPMQQSIFSQIPYQSTQSKQYNIYSNEKTYVDTIPINQNNQVKIIDTENINTNPKTDNNINTNINTEQIKVSPLRLYAHINKIRR